MYLLVFFFGNLLWCFYWTGVRGRVRLFLNCLVVATRSWMRNYSKQETGERLHDSTPLGATEFPPVMQMGRREQAERTERQRNIQREEEESTEYIMTASEDGSSQLHLSLALVTEPTPWVIQKLYCIVYIQYTRPFQPPAVIHNTPQPSVRPPLTHFMPLESVSGLWYTRLCVHVCVCPR